MRSLHASEEPNSGITDPPGFRELVETIEMLVAVRQRRNALETAEALLLEQARREGLRSEAVFIDSKRAARFGDSSQRTELAHRSIVADVALALHDGHDAIWQRMAQGQALAARAPQTLDNAVAGRVAWRNAAYLADQVSELAPSIAAKVDAAAAERACTATPALFRKRVRKLIEDAHPTPMEVRHADAACQRNVRTDIAADGMGYLTLFAPITAINAIWDRLSRTAKRVRYGTGQNVGDRIASNVGNEKTNERRGEPGGAEIRSEVCDPRTLEQLRADTAIALLLDDGTLDLAAANATPARGLASSGTIPPPKASLNTTPTSTIWPSTVSPGAVSPSVASPGAAGPSTVSSRALSSRAVSAVVASAPERDGVNQGFDVLQSGSRFSLAQVARSIRPKVFVTVPVLTLIGAVDAPAMLDGDIPIDADTARELAGLATSFTRVLTDPYHGTVIGVDARTYRPPADLRQWIQLRDATCRFPGCTRRSVETDVDHNTEWSQGGATSANNLTALCRRHHSLKTVGAFTAEQASLGSNPLPDRPNKLVADAPLTWTSPSGRKATTTVDPVPATLHPPGSRLPNGPWPEPDLNDDYSDVPF